MFRIIGSIVLIVAVVGAYFVANQDATTTSADHAAPAPNSFDIKAN